MQVVVLFHEEQVREREQHQRRQQVDPVPRHQRERAMLCEQRTEVDESERHRQLQQHIYPRHERVAQAQLVRHQLISVLAVRLSQVLVKEYAVHYGQAPVHPVHQQQRQPAHVLRAHNEHPEREEQDERDAHAAHVAREAPRLPARAEVEEAEHQQRRDDEVCLHRGIFSNREAFDSCCEAVKEYRLA